MTTLADIEVAADALAPAEKQELFLFLLERLRARGQALPEPRKFNNAQIASWIAEDEADLRNFRESK